MLRCLGRICCGGVEPTALAPPPPEDLGKLKTVWEPKLPEEGTAPQAPSSFETLADEHELLLAPPGAEVPIAVVTPDFPRNVNRLLIMIPSAAAAPGTWDTSVKDASGLSVPVFKWAQANGYAACLFSASALEADAGETWDRVLKGSPAGSVVVLAASGALPMLARALQPVHPLLFSRFRAALAPFEARHAWPPSWPGQLSKELVAHLAAVLVRPPADWEAQEPRKVLASLFELLALREGSFEKAEAKKYQSFQGLKENDMPGMKRLGVEQRIARLDRDRGDDELARLLKQNEAAKYQDDDEPGVD
mmetsp:Transcript_66559/g.138976  ORF Transcript_66559/g.138976 Transcript_66559/m.138976 type:complete len:306 (+) Transcript_66559:69-986(+)